MQPTLFDGIEDKGFPKYHEENPHIYTAFKIYTLKAIARGHKNFSAEFVFNVLRWETHIDGNDDFKINNNYRSFYSRMFMNEFREYAGFFRTRKSKFDDVLNKAA